MKKPSLYPDEPVCIICGNPYVHRHHIFYGVGRRKISDDEGCYCYLCYLHHNGSNKGVHFDKEFDSSLKADCQKRWEKREGMPDGNHSAFIEVFGRNYL